MEFFGGSLLVEFCGGNATLYKMYGMFGLEHHTLEINGDVTSHHTGQTTNNRHKIHATQLNAKRLVSQKLIQAKGKSKNPTRPKFVGDI